MSLNFNSSIYNGVNDPWIYGTAGMGMSNKEKGNRTLRARNKLTKALRVRAPQSTPPPTPPSTPITPPRRHLAPGAPPPTPAIGLANMAITPMSTPSTGKSIDANSFEEIVRQLDNEEGSQIIITKDPEGNLYAKLCLAGQCAAAIALTAAISPAVAGMGALAAGTAAAAHFFRAKPRRRRNRKSRKNNRR